jgi:predicted unusual protein kinase regulating ubiquinone biosynthesis (AarF/ABC1/UbiB family)
MRVLVPFSSYFPQMLGHGMSLNNSAWQEPGLPVTLPETTTPMDWSSISVTDKQQLPFAARLAAPVRASLLGAQRQELPQELQAPQKKQIPRAYLANIPDQFKAYTDILQNGIKTQADFDKALDLISTLQPSLGRLIEIYRADPVAVHFIDAKETSHVIRESSDFTDRTTTYAKGIYLSEGVDIFVLIHELTHAIPFASMRETPGYSWSSQKMIDLGDGKVFPEGSDLLDQKDKRSMKKVILKEKETLFSKKTSLFHNIHDSFRFLYSDDYRRNTLSGIYSRIVGNHCRDEAISALAEVLLLESLQNNGFVVPDKPELKEGLEIIRQQRAIKADRYNMLNAFYSHDFYLGDNHFLFYNLRALFFVAKKIGLDKKNVHDLIWSSCIDETGITIAGESYDSDDLVCITPQDIFRYLKEHVSRPLKPGDPLLPMQIRLRRYLAVLGVSRVLFEESTDSDLMGQRVVTDVDFGQERPTGLQDCDEARIAEKPHQTKQRVQLSATFVDFLQRMFAYSEKEISINVEAYLRFAEFCDPTVSPKMYQNIYDLIFSDQFDQEAAIALAFSCFNSGYDSIGEKIIIRALCKSETKVSSDDLGMLTKGHVRALNGWHDKWNYAVAELAKNGHVQVARLIVWGVEKGVESSARDYFRSLGSIIVSVSVDSGENSHDSLPASFAKRLRSLAKAYSGDTISVDLIINYLNSSTIRPCDQDLLILQKEFENINKNYQSRLQRANKLRHDLYSYLATEDPQTDQGSWIETMMASEYTAIQKRLRTRRTVYKKQGPSLPSTFSAQMHYLHTSAQVKRARWITFFSEEGETFEFGKPIDYEQALLGEQAGLLTSAMKFPQNHVWILKRIKGMPNSMTKLGLIEQYWQAYAHGLTKKQTDSLIVLWEGLIEELAANLEQWRYIEDTSLRAFYHQRTTVQVPEDYHQSHFYHKHRLRLAKALIGNESYKEHARKILDETSFVGGIHRGLYSDQSAIERLRMTHEETVFRAYASYHGKVTALLLLADAYPDEARHYIEEAERILAHHSVKPHAEWALLGGHEAYLRGLIAAQWFSFEETQRASQYLEQASSGIDEIRSDLRKELEPPKIPARARAIHAEMIDALDIPFWYRGHLPIMVEKGFLPLRSPKAERESLVDVKKELMLLAPIERIAQQKKPLTEIQIAEVKSILTRISNDLDQVNWYYPLIAIITAARLLAQNQTLIAETQRMYQLAIRGLSLARGAQETFDRDGEILVRSLWDSLLPAPIKDELFSDLVDRLFPEDRQELWGQTIKLKFMSGSREEPGLFHYIFRSTDYPKAEKTLLKKFANVVSELEFDRSDSVQTRAKKLFMLAEIFQHIAMKGEYLDKDNFDQISSLASDDSDYQSQLRLLHHQQRDVENDFKDHETYPSVEAILEGHYDVGDVYDCLAKDLELLRQGEHAQDYLEKLLPLMKALYSREVKTAGVLRDVTDFNQLPIIALLTEYLDEVFEKGAEPGERDKSLLKVIFDHTDQETAHASISYYRDIFKRRQLAGSVREMAFLGLVRGGDYSSYVAHCFAERKAEGLSLEVFFNLLIDFEKEMWRKDDFSLSLVLEDERFRTEGSDSWLSQRPTSARVGLRRTQVEREEVFYKALKTHTIKKHDRDTVQIDRINDYESEWYEFYEAMIRALIIMSTKDEALLEEAIEDRVPESKYLLKQLITNFRDFYRATPDKIRGQVYMHLAKVLTCEEIAFEDMDNLDTDDVLDEYHGITHVYKDRNDLSEAELRARDEVEGWLREIARDRWDLDIEDFYEELMMLFDSYTFSSLEDQANQEVVDMLPGVPYSRFHSSSWNASQMQFIQDELGFNTQQQAKEYLEILRAELPKEFRARSLRRDRVRFHQVEMPRVFAGRPELIEFLAMRYYLELPPGEQKELIRELDILDDEAAESELIRRFFELTVVKVGQFLSIWPEVPQEHRAALEGLQDNVPKGDFQDVKDTIRVEFPHKEAEALIGRIEAEPINVGTIGEVYRVRLGDGKYRVLKVIPSAKRAKVELTLKRLRHIYYILDNYRDKVPGAPTSMRITEQLITSMEKELDLRNEMQEAIAFGRQLRSFQDGKFAQRVRIPKYSKKYCSRSILLMSYESAQKITQATDSELAQKAASYLDEMLNAMIAGTDVYPDDLHPGNILVDAGPDDETDQWKVVLLDFGRMGRTTEAERLLILRFVMAAGMKHRESLQLVLEEMSGASALSLDYDAEAFSLAMDTLIEESELQDPYELLSRLLTLAGQHYLEIDLAFIQVLKAKMTLRGTLNAVKH